MTTVPAMAWRIARRDLRPGLRGLKGFRVFVGCLALGVASITGVQSTMSAILGGLRDDGRTILGGDIVLRSVYRDLAVEDRAFIETEAARITHFVELRTMARRSDRVESSDTGTLDPAADASNENSPAVLVELKAVDDLYPLFGTLEAVDGQGRALSLDDALANTGRGWGALVDPALANRLALGAGDRLVLGDMTFEVRGTIVREPDRASSGGPFGFWPRVLTSAQAIEDSQLVREGSLIYHQYALRLDPEGAAEPGDASGRLDDSRERIIERLRDEGWGVRSYENAAPGIERATTRLGTFLSLVGLTALLVGGVGVGNAVRAWLDNRIETIAVLKCLGASRSVIFLALFFQLMVIAAIGILAGLALGVMASVMAAKIVGGMLPVPLKVGLYPEALMLSAAFGLLTAIAFTLWPLSRAQQTPATTLFRGGGLAATRGGRPLHLLMALAMGAGLAGLAAVSAQNQAFALWFIAGAVLLLILLRAMGWVTVIVASAWSRSKLSRTGRIGARWRMAVANLHRPANATSDTVLSVGLGLSVLVAVALVEGNLRRGIVDSLPDDAPAFFFVGVESSRVDALESALESVDGARDFLALPFLRGRIVRVNGLDPQQALVDDEHGWLIRGDRGLSYSAQAPDAKVVAGQWWPEDYAGPPLLSVDVDVIDAFDLGLGDTITLSVLGREITAEVRHVREVEWEGMRVDFALLLSPEPMRRAPHSAVATIRADEEAEARIERLLAEEFPEVTAVRTREAMARIGDLMGSIATAARSVGGLTLLVGALVLAGAVAAGHRRRTFESVVLKVLGTKRRDVALIHGTEFALLGAITGILAALAGTLGAWAMVTRVLDQDWIFLPGTVALTIAFCMALTLALGLWGTWRALGESPSNYLRNE
ncbi:ABC transporter permease [Thioalkalivibrio sp. HK1]|uniref:ABC transporter permease n=1 Tax=Thioalkalivibrio sp. HK1 TaxID=1469245 RepID=UPI0004719BBF|nr:FtsX-like permease family protein [Thioalkalivibrio sp. HK1]